MSNAGQHCCGLCARGGFACVGTAALPIWYPQQALRAASLKRPVVENGGFARHHDALIICTVNQSIFLHCPACRAKHCSVVRRHERSTQLSTLPTPPVKLSTAPPTGPCVECLYFRVPSSDIRIPFKRMSEVSVRVGSLCVDWQWRTLSWLRFTRRKPLQTKRGHYQSLCLTGDQKFGKCDFKIDNVTDDTKLG